MYVNVGNSPPKVTKGHFPGRYRGSHGTRAKRQRDARDRLAMIGERPLCQQVASAEELLHSGHQRAFARADARSQGTEPERGQGPERCAASNCEAFFDSGH